MNRQIYSVCLSVCGGIFMIHWRIEDVSILASTDKWNNIMHLKNPDCVLYYQQVHDVITLLQLFFWIVLSWGKACDHSWGMRGVPEECLTHKWCKAYQQHGEGNTGKQWKRNMMVTITVRARLCFMLREMSERVRKLGHSPHMLFNTWHQGLTKVHNSYGKRGEEQTGKGK